MNTVQNKKVIIQENLSDNPFGLDVETQVKEEGQQQVIKDNHKRIKQQRSNAKFESESNQHEINAENIEYQDNRNQNPNDVQNIKEEQLISQNSPTKQVRQFQFKRDQGNLFADKNYYQVRIAEVRKTQKLFMDDQIQVNVQSDHQRSQNITSPKSKDHIQNLRSTQIKVREWNAQSSQSKFQIGQSRKKVAVESGSPREQFRTGQFGIPNDNQKNNQVQIKESENINQRIQQLEQVFKMSGFKVAFDKQEPFMDQKQFASIKRFNKEDNEEEIQQIQKRSDDSHNKSAIDLINQAFGGQNLNANLNSNQPKAESKRNRSRISSSDKNNRQNDFDLNMILNQKVLDVDKLKGATQYRNSQTPSLFNNIAKNLDQYKFKENSHLHSKKEQNNFLEMLAMQTVNNQFRTQTSSSNFRDNFRKGSQDIRNTGNPKMAFTVNQNWLPSVVSAKNNFKQDINFKKTKDNTKASEQVSIHPVIENIKIAQTANVNVNTNKNQQQSNKSRSQSNSQKIVSTVQKKLSIVTNPPVIDLLQENQRKGNMFDRPENIINNDQGYLSKSIVIRGSDPFEEAAHLHSNTHQSHQKNNAISQSRLSHISNKNKSSIGLPNLSGNVSSINYNKSEGPITFSENFQQKVPCNQSSYHTLQKKQERKGIVAIKMDKHEIIHKSFFMPNYVMYHIQVFYKQAKVEKSELFEDVLNMEIVQQKKKQSPNPNVLKYLIVKRNYQDFERFRVILQKHYPGFHLPYLQSNSWISETNIDFVRKQKSMLQLFLNDLIKNPYIVNSQLLHDFITTEDHKSFKRKIQQYEKGKIVAPPKSIEELILPQKDILVRLTEDQKIFCDHFTPYLESMSMSFEKLNDLYNSLTNALESAAANMNSISELLRSMGKRTRNFNTRVSTSGCGYKITDNLPSLLDKMSQSYKVQSQTLKSRKSLIVNDFLPLIKYQNLNINSFRKLITIRNQFTSNYLKRINQEAKQLSNYPSQNANVYLGERCHYGKNGLLLEESRDILVYKYQTAFLNTQVCTEGQRLFAQTTDKIDKSWKELVKKQIQKLYQEKIEIEKIIKQQEMSVV